jgi:RNA polymerase sigma-70 factor (ECF subfamily)
LYSILANCYRDHFRRLRTAEEIDENTIIHDSTPEKESSEQEIVLKVRAAIARLAEGQRQVVTLVDIQGLSYMEVAQILNVPIGTVMSRLCRARYALKDLLGELAPKLAAEETKIRRIK